MKRICKLLSLILTVSMLASMLVGFVPANATLGNEAFVLPDIVDSAEAQEKGYVGRVKSAEKDLYTFIFANDDGTNTMRIYSHPVKYIADDGTVRDISLGIEQKRGGGFVTADHEIITTFESKLTDGISLEYDDIEIMLVPSLGLSAVPKAELSKDGKVVTYKMNDTTSFVYELTYAGFKEDIVVEKYTGQTEYTFTIFTNGLTLVEEDGSYYLADSEGNIEATVGDIIVFTADERNNTMGRMTYETVRKNQEYVLTIHLDAEYLADERTAYPIRIDPTIEVNYTNNGAGAIEDVTLNSTATSSATSTSLTIGLRNSYGIGRVLMRFPTINFSSMGNNITITSAAVEIRDLICDDINVEVSCYIFGGNAWTESTASWDTVNPNSFHTLLSSHVIAYSYGVQQPTAHRYSFDITQAVESWRIGTYEDKGIIFKADSSVENGSTAKYKTIASYNRASYKPSLTITYQDASIVRSLYYSEYDPDKFNNPGSDPAVDSESDLIQYRMNCYGYAFGFILDGPALIINATPDYGWETPAGYKQQPGEFASTANKANVRNIDIQDDPETLMENVVYNMGIDADRLGYDIEEYFPISDTVDQFGTNSRLIAVVTGNGDFHFYMQHNDGTWSHKPGSGTVSNMSIDSGEELTNSNIQDYANEGYYVSDQLRFFIIKKTAVVDYPHSPRYCEKITGPCNHVQIQLYLRERAGDYPQTARNVDTGGVAAQIDFAEDHDVYCFKPLTTGTYTITTTCTSGANLDCYVYANTGIVIKRDSSSIQPWITIRLVAGQRYYFDVYNSSKTITDYTFLITQEG